ncbi:MAG TPA: 4-hydroxy-tetrahydrodipicolinate synthase [Clostridiales bacterium]|jgi:4-hydroxy-tetrahydrodipicolinate synthase|nr:4-hydroxy-tetrahydrodipicolinate synthase [Clostridiales bacterium]
MKEIIFSGSGVALVTPFTETGVDFNKLAELCEFHIQNNTDALVIAGTTGEASTMPDEEHVETVRQAVIAAGGRVPVIAGVGSNDTAHGVNLAKMAAKAGADALLNCTPYYNKASQSGLVLHFSAYAKAVDLPYILYNVPSRTAVNINPETYYELSKIDNIVGVKECNINQMAETASLCGDNLTLYSGEDGMILPCLSFGGRGVISVMANIIPKETHEMVASYLAGNTRRATELQIWATPLVKAIFSDVNPIPIKAALNLCGFNVGPCRLPLSDMSESGLANLRQVLQSYNLLSA